VSQAGPPTGGRLRLVVAYDGTDFRGFAAQADQRTVEGTLLDALEKVLHSPREVLGLVCAGRTDAGVHAWGQVVSIQTLAAADPEHLRRALNGMLAPEIVVRCCDHAPAEFDARRSARWRRYQYTIVNRPEPDPFLARYSWWVPEQLDLSQLRLAADPFVGEHDFASFCRKGPEGTTTRRRVLESQWIDSDDDVLVYEIKATAFCWQMVRSVVGTIVEAGSGRISPGDIMPIIRANNRQAARRLAPPQGLCLMKVGY